MKMNQKAALQALGRVPSGLFVLTAGKGDDAVAMLVSFVQQLSIEPLILGVALKPDRAASAAIAREKHFVINVLHAGDKSLLRTFAKKSTAGKDAFAAVSSRPLPAGGAILLEACAFIECELSSVLEVGGDHQLYVGRVVGGDLLGDPAARPTVHVRQDGGKY
jgi:flavin reductase (DIM6/NTAB) family NADH-FMN oxidoreductase RutF